MEVNFVPKSKMSKVRNKILIKINICLLLKRVLAPIAIPSRVEFDRKIRKELGFPKVSD